MAAPSGQPRADAADPTVPEAGAANAIGLLAANDRRKLPDESWGGSVQHLGGQEVKSYSYFYSGSTSDKPTKTTTGSKTNSNTNSQLSKSTIVEGAASSSEMRRRQPLLLLPSSSLESDANKEEKNGVERGRRNKGKPHASGCRASYANE